MSENSKAVEPGTSRRRSLSILIEISAGPALLVAAIGLLSSWLKGDSTGQAIWGCLSILSLAALLWRAWARLLGPVLLYDLVRLARRHRYFLIRVIYIGAVLALLYWQYRDTFISVYRAGWIPGFIPASRMLPPGYESLSQAAEFSEQFFNKFMLFEFVLIVLLAPAYTAGAIAEEKERKTIEFMLSTDLRNREIILSKFLARFANLGLLVITGFPVLSAMQFLGGVDPDLLLAAFAALCLTLASLTSLSIWCSVYSRKTRDAILLTYSVVAAYVSAGVLGQMVVSSRPAAGTSPTAIHATLEAGVNKFNSGNLPVVLYRLRESMNQASGPVTAIAFTPTGQGIIAFTPTGTPLVRTGAGPVLSSLVPAFLRDYAIFNGTLIIIALAWAILRVRAVALSQLSGVIKAKARPRKLWLRPAMGRSPMIWKEIFVEPGFKFTRMGRIVLALLIVLSFLPAGWISWDAAHQHVGVSPKRDAAGRVIQSGQPQMSTIQWGPLGEKLNPWVRITGTAVACLLLIGVAVRGATSIGGERDRDTLDALLATPLQSKDILLAKWLGTVFSVRWGWLWLGAIWSIGMVTGAMHPALIMLELVAWTVFASFLAGLGIWFSVSSPTTLRATMLMLSVVALLGLGPWMPLMCCLPSAFISVWLHQTDLWQLSQVAQGLSGFFAALTPPAVLYKLSASYAEVGPNWDMEGMVCFYGLFFWVIGSVNIWSITRRRFRRMTARMSHSRTRYVAGGIRWADPWQEPPVAGQRGAT